MIHFPAHGSLYEEAYKMLHELTTWKTGIYLNGESIFCCKHKRIPLRLFTKFPLNSVFVLQINLHNLFCPKTRAVICNMTIASMCSTSRGHSTFKGGFWAFVFLMGVNFQVYGIFLFYRGLPTEVIIIQLTLLIKR